MPGIEALISQLPPLPLESPNQVLRKGLNSLRQEVYSSGHCRVGMWVRPPEDEEQKPQGEDPVLTVLFLKLMLKRMKGLAF
jgi:hypothetical protein